MMPVELVHAARKIAGLPPMVDEPEGGKTG
jgi:hypothetical protein